MNKNRTNSDKSQLNDYWCHTCKFFHTDSEQDSRNKICSHCNQHKSYLQLHQRIVYYNHGFANREVFQCHDCQKEEVKSFNLTYVLSNVQSDSDAYESICQTIKELCSKSKSKAVNYYDAVKTAYLKSIQNPNDDKYRYPMTIRNYLLDRGVKNVNRINKNLEPLWEFTYHLVNTEKRIKIVNRDPDNLLVSWIDR